MKIGQLFILLVTFSIFIACRSEFERIRTSGNATLIYEEANRFFQDEEYDKAIILYELIIPVYRGKREAEDIYFNYANAHFLDRRYILSSHYFDTFSSTYTGSTKREEAMYLSALSHYKVSPRYELDQDETSQAIEAFQLFVNTFPTSERVAECNSLIDEMRAKLEKKAFESAKLYHDMANYSSAVVAYENMLKEFPGTSRQEEVRYRMVRANFSLAENSIFTRQEERFRHTEEQCRIYLRKYSGTDRASDVEKIQNECLTALKTFQ
jgi:outer membrane protein assembly factor BamD